MNDLMMRTADVANAIDWPQPWQQMASITEGAHWYLPLLGVDRRTRTRALAARCPAMSPNVADREACSPISDRQPAANISLYERHGFEVLGPPVRQLARDHADAAQAPEKIERR